MCGKDSDTRIGAHAIESFFVECDNSFQRMFFEYVSFDALLLFGFACNSRLWYNNDGSCILRQAIKQMFSESDFVEFWALLGAL